MAIEHETSSGNVFEDIGVDNPAEALVKAQLASKIVSIIKHRHLKQKDAALVLGIDQPKVSKLQRGQLRDFSLQRLIGFVMLLDRDVEIVIKKRPPGRLQSRIAIST